MLPHRWGPGFSDTKRKQRLQNSQLEKQKTNDIRPNIGQIHQPRNFAFLRLRFLLSGLLGLVHHQLHFILPQRSGKNIFVLTNPCPPSWSRKAHHVASLWQGMGKTGPSAITTQETVNKCKQRYKRFVQYSASMLNSHRLAASSSPYMPSRVRFMPSS